MRATLYLLSFATLMLSDPASATGAELSIVSASYIGKSGDAVVGAGIQSDGTLAVAANISGGPLLHSGEPGGGFVVRLSPDATRILSSIRIAGRVDDLALDGADRLYVASAEGAVQLDAQATQVLWRRETGGVCNRIDAAPDGHCVVLHYDRDEDTSTGQGTLFVLAPDGQRLGSFAGHRNTLDICLDAASQTVIQIGWRQANSWEGKRVYPVQIAYVQGRSYSGEEKYMLYDWSTDRDAPRFLNKPANNMADTRGYRCAIGQDGLLYCAFECAGGNHIFRWEPRLEGGQWKNASPKKAKGDKYHAFYNSRAEHKTFLARYEPATGTYLAGQEFCGRLSSGRANAVRVKNGGLTATAEGSILVGGTSASGLPVTLYPPGTGDYNGGAFLLGMTPDLAKRLYCVRFNPGGQTRAVVARMAGDKQVVLAGGSINTKSADEFGTVQALQPAGEAGCGFLVLLQAD